MTDITKIIKGLGEATAHIERRVSDRYIGYSKQACIDAIELLKEQQAKNEQLKIDREIMSRYINYHNCNTCNRMCEYRPSPGERVRANCFRWIPFENAVNVPVGKTGEQE